MITDPGLIQRHFPYITQDVAAALHVRRAGWFSAQQLGQYMLDQAKAQGITVRRATLSNVLVDKGCITGVELNGNERIHTDTFVNAAGPFLREVAGYCGINLPIDTELHQKVAFVDNLNSIDRNAPLIIWTDPQVLSWTAEELDFIGSDRWLLDELPAGLHCRPEGGAGSQTILMLWDYQQKIIEPVWPLPIDELHADVVLRGMVRMVPKMAAYLERAQRPRLDGGYYTKAIDNLPIIGSLPLQGGYIIGALSGYGLMAACAAGELIASTITQAELPAFAHDFNPMRFENQDYLASIQEQKDSLQL